MNSTHSQKADIVKTLTLHLLRFLLLLVVVLGFPLLAKATHIVGGEISYRCLGNNEYEITLKVYRDCTRGTEEGYDNPGYIGIYDVTGSVFIRRLNVAPGKIARLNPLVDACFVEPGNKCVDTTTYITKTVLDPNPPNGGYLFTYVRCCRNADVTNIEDPLRAGAVYQIELKREAMLRCNSSPTFVNFPPNFLCVNRPWRFDHSARDRDGDSLVYKLCTPIQGGSFTNPRPIPPRNPPPFDSIQWRNGYGLDRMFGGGDAPLRIDPITGLLTATPNIQGQFVVGVCVLEYDRVTKRLLSETRRDFQYNLIACSDPIANLRDTIPTCQGATVSLNPDFVNMSGVTYRWSPGRLVSDSTAANPTFVGNQTTTFTVTVIKGSCSSTKTVVVIVRPNPTVDLLSDKTSICIGDSITLTANGTGGTPPLTYNWSGGLNSNPVQVVKPTQNTKYFVTVTDANGCNAKDSINIIVSPPPVVRITTGETTICVGDSVRLAVQISGGATPYIIRWNNASVTGQNPVVRPTVTTTYRVTVTGGNNCSTTAQVTITVRPRPNVDLGADQSICLGDTATITATATNGTPPYTFAWNRGSGQTQRVRPLLSTFYIVTVTDANGCSDVDSVFVKVNFVPAVILSADDFFLCEGESTTLRARVNTGTPPLTFVWNPAFRNDSVQVVSPTQTTTYAVTLTDANGCSATDNIRVNVTELPDLELDTAFCAANLNSYQVNVITNADSVRATAGRVVSNGNGTFSIINIPLGQNITVTAINSSTECLKTLQVQAVQCACPVVDAPISGGNKGACVGSPFPALTASVPSGQTVDWFSTASGGTPILQGSTNFTPTQAGTYFAQARDLTTGCISATRTAITLSINPLPTAQASANRTTVCAGDEVQLSANATGGTAPYQFVWNQGLGSGQNRTATPAITTTYTVTATDANGCSDTAQININVNALPFIDSIRTQCAPDLLSYSVRIITNGNIVIANIGTVTNLGNGRFEISNIPIAQDLVLVATFNATGCGRLASVNKPNCQCPVVNSPISGGDKTICTGQPLPVLTVTVESGQTADWYSEAIGGTLLLSGSTTFTPTQPGTYYATARDLVTNCTSNVRTAAKLTVNPSPIVDATASQTTICAGQTANLSATVSGGTAPFNYTWNQGLGIGQNKIVSPSQTTTYTVSVTDALGCSAIDSIIINVNPAPTAVINADKTTICPSDTATLTASATGGLAPYTFNWNQGLGSGAVKTVNPTQTTIYSVTITDTNGCADTTQITINVRQRPSVTIDANRTTICAGDTTLLTASATGTAPFTFSWNENLGAGTTKVVNPTQTTTYIVTVTDANGCTNTAQVTILVNEGLQVNLSANDESLCLGETATLTANVGNGVAPFRYTWNQGLAANASQTVTPTQTTTYIVTVTDANGCAGSDTIIIRINSAPTAFVASSQDTICAGDTTTLTASATGGLAPYTFNWNQNLGSGAVKTVNPSPTTTYIITVTDANGCADTAQITIKVNPKPVITAIAGRATICLGDTTLLTASATGTGPFTFDWNQGLGAGTSKIVNPTQTTTYTVTVTDANGCNNIAQVTVTVTNGLNVSLTANDESICQGQSATLTATSSNGVRPFTYTWNQGLTPDSIQTVRPTQNTTYIVIIRDANGCVGSDTIVVTVNPPPTGAVSATATTICEGDSTTLTATATGGASPYTFNWNQELGAGATQTVNPSDTTIYTVIVTDANGCADTAQITINVNPGPDITARAGRSTICAGDTTALTASATGIAPFTFEWNQGLGIGANKIVTPTQTTTYTVTVTDANGCSNTAQVTVTVTTALEVNIATNEDSLCVGESARLTATSSNGVRPFTYRWNQGLRPDSTQTVTPTQTTTYIVTITDANGCIGTDSITIIVNQPPTLTLSASKTTICEGDSTTVRATVTGGRAPYTFIWNISASTRDTATISPTDTVICGVIVIDANGCRDTAQLQINVNPKPVISAIAGRATICAGDTTSLTASATGNGPFTYTWNQGLGTGANKVVNPSQTTTYTVTVTDANGCSDTAQVTITVTQGLNVNITADDESICQGQSARLTATSSNGVRPFTYTWNQGLSNDSIQTVRPTQTTTYTVTLRDANGCVGSDTITITVNPPPTGAISANQTTICPGDTATLTASATGGLAPYTFNWNQGLGSGAVKTVNPTQTTTYSVIINDANGCSDTAQITINVFQKPEVTLTAGRSTICAGDTTLLTTTFSGGTAPYTFRWTPNTIAGLSQVINPTETTTYSVTITDANGCRDTAQVIVTVTTALQVSLTANDQSLCPGQSAILTATSVNGVRPFSYRWNPTLPADSTQTVTPTQTTTYTVTITDANGCFGTTSINITVNPNPNVDAQAARLTICAGDSTRLSANATGGATPYTFAWSPGGLSGQNPIVRPMESTTYTVTVTDANGCTATDSVRVTVNPMPTANAGASDDNICLGDSTVLVAGGRGGLPPYTFNWNQGLGAGQPKTVRPTQTTTYTVTVTDANGCFATANVTVTVSPPPTVTISATKNTICLGDTTTLTANPSGGNGPFTFVWNQGLNGNPVQNVSPTQTTTYAVTITNAAGCTATAQITITVNPKPTATATADKDTVCAGDPVVLTASATGGAGNFTFNWSNGASGNSQTVNPTVTTTYIVTVTDRSGCTDTAQVRIFVNPRPIANAGNDTLSCSGSPVTLNATASSGTPPYTFNWNQNLGLGASKTVRPTQPTTYTVTVTDSKGCTSTDQVLVDVFPLPSDLPLDSITTCANIATPVAPNIIPRATYQWRPAGILSNPNIANPTVTTDRDTVLFVTITYKNTCVVLDTVRVKVFPKINLRANNDTTLCVAGNFTLTATSSVANTQFVWSNNRNFQPQLGTGASLVVTPVGNVTYYVRATDANGCSETDSVNIRSFPIQATLPPETILCEPTTQTRLTVTNQGAGQILTYDWNPKNAIITRPDSASVLVNPNLSNQFTVQLQNQFGCRDTLEAKVTIVNLSGLDARVEPDTIFAGDSARLTVFLPVPCPDCTYQWTPAGSLSNPNIANPIAKPTETTAYRVVVTKGQCRAEDVVALVVQTVICDKEHIYLPSAFTPNDDGVNDVWRLRSNFNDELIIKVIVYNRWGQKVFESVNPNFEWDGSFNGRDLPPDVYGYRMEVTCPANQKLILQGNVTLLR